jgi:peptidoglycan/xylan/chitin deacetylase (PgdA/CDA1 family)
MDKPADFPFDDDLISASAAEYESQLRFIAKHFDVFNFKTLQSHVERTGRFPERSLIMTFDDGYIDNYEVVYPMVKRFGFTATMFVTAGFIGQNKLFWWDKLAYVVKHTKRDRIDLDAPFEITMSLDEYPQRQAAARAVIKRAKTMLDEEKEELILKLSEQLDVEIDDAQHRTMMTWEQLREMSRDGIEIGAHSVNHPIFSNVDEERLRHEVTRSKQMIEEHIGDEVITFGSPGRGILTAPQKVDFESRLSRIVEEAGYRFSTQYRWGLAYENQFTPYRVPRLGVEVHDKGRLFPAKLSYPELLVY